MNTNRIVRVRGDTRRWAIAEPRKDTPRISHTIAGNQPQRLAATIAPMMGPAAAIDLKWYPNRMLRLVGMKSTPSIYRTAGVLRFGSYWMTWRSIRRA